MLADAGSIPAISTNTKGQPFFGWPFLLVDLMWMRSRVPGSKKLPGAIFNVRLLHGPEGVSLMDETNIPAISTNTKGQPFFGWPFLLVDLVWMRSRVPGSKKLPGAIFNVRLLHGPEGVSLMDETNIPAISTNTEGQPFFGWPFLLVDLMWMRSRVPGSKKLPGAIFNVRLLHGPEGVSLMDETNIPAISTNTQRSAVFRLAFFIG